MAATRSADRSLQLLHRHTGSALAIEHSAMPLRNTCPVPSLTDPSSLQQARHDQHMPSRRSRRRPYDRS
eukprot:3421255-Pleurochrysis_carterae.AAC.1